MKLWEMFWGNYFRHILLPTRGFKTLGIYLFPEKPRSFQNRSQKKDFVEIELCKFPNTEMYHNNIKSDISNPKSGFSNN